MPFGFQGHGEMPKSGFQGGVKRRQNPVHQRAAFFACGREKESPCNAVTVQLGAMNPLLPPKPQSGR